MVLAASHSSKSHKFQQINKRTATFKTKSQKTAPKLNEPRNTSVRNHPTPTAQSELKSKKRQLATTPRQRIQTQNIKHQNLSRSQSLTSNRAPISKSSQRLITGSKKRNDLKSPTDRQPENLPRSSWFTGKAKPWLSTRRGLTAKNLQQKAVLASDKAQPIKKKKPASSQKESNFSDQFDISYQKGTSSWSSNPSRTKDSDESLALQGEHHIKAFTKLDSSDNFDISAGPELIVKERKQNTALNNTKTQPESELGVGMHFLYNF
ncbi:MAG: hypothetical protein IJT59_06395 [Desulfovibrionaceae bacterium]|nr:hypothetical protein [Desulfovibrionaceae bacterium]